MPQNFVETAVAKQLQHYLFSTDLFPVLQSAYRPKHSIETALLKVTLLLLLNLSAAFETVDHDTLLHRLQFKFGINGKVLSWFSSYLSERSQQKAINEDTLRRIRVAMWCPSRFLFGSLIIYPVLEQSLRDHQTPFSYDLLLR